MNQLDAIMPLLNLISSVALFLFTTIPGLCMTGLLLVLWLFFSIALRLKSQGGTENLPFLQMLALVFHETGKMAGRLFTSIPVLLGVLLVIFLLSGLRETLNGVNSFVENQQKISQLQTAISLLDTRYRVAQVDITDQNSAETSLSISFFNQKGNQVVSSQMITLPGRDIYFDSIVMNFDYTQIESGEKKNIALPYRVFSELIPASEGVPLKITGEDGLPYIFQRNHEDLYGIEDDAFNNVLLEISDYLRDPELARTDGVRTLYGSAVHRRVNLGDSFVIWIEQTGGLVLRDENNF